MLVAPGAAEVVALVPTLGSDVDRLRRCVTALAAQSGDLAVVVLVNSPEGGRVRDLPGEVVVVECGLNLGWGGALTLGRSLAEPAFLWLVQDDMVAEPDALAVLRAALEAEPGTAVVTPITVGDDGLVPAGSLGGTLDDDGVLRRWHPPEATPPEDLSGLGDLSYVASRGMLVRTNAWDDAGGMSPLFHPVMYADVDFCVGLQRAGWSVAAVSGSRIHHRQLGSTTRPFAEFLGRRNAALFAARRFPGSEVDDGRPSPAASLGGPVHPDLSPALVTSIAQAAADALLHLGSHHTAAVTSLEDRVASLNVQRAALEDRVATLEASAVERESDLQSLRRRLRRSRRRLLRTRRRLATARSWRGRLGLARTR
ncbi:glycosyltransferase family 2 protein [Nocardioides dilutus]